MNVFAGRVLVIYWLLKAVIDFNIYVLNIFTATVHCPRTTVF